MTRTRLSAVALTAALAASGGLITAAPASAAVTCASPTWTAQYYANASFSGTPKLTACDSAIAENMGSGDPAGVTLPNDNFSIRWSLTRDFGSGGPFRLNAATQDGMRVYIDGVRKIDLWKNVSTTARKTVDLSIPAGKHTIRVDYVAWTGYAYAGFTYAPRTEATVDTVKPLYPTGLTATYSATTLKTTLKWAANKEMDLAGYRVYRRLSLTQWAKVSGTSLLTSPTFVDTPPATGQTYLYEVRAVDNAGRESTGSLDVTATTVDQTAPAAPKGLGGWTPDFSEKVNLSWDGNAEADLAGYHVYRSTSRPVALTAANRVSGDKPLSGSWYQGPLPQTGDTYYYVVTAVDTQGNESAASGTAEFYTRDKTGPVDTAYNAKAVEDERGVTLTWDTSQATSADFVGYVVLRYDRPRTEPGRTIVEVGKNIRGTSFTDAAPPPGATYYYSVVAVDGAGNGGIPSDEMAVTVAGNTTPPPPVTGVTVTAEENGVSLSWNASAEPGLDHYRILRGTLVDGQWVYKPLQDAWTLKPWEFTQTHHLDRTVADGEQVRYGVVAVDQYGNQLTPGTGASVQDVTELDLRPDADAGPAVGDTPIGHLYGDVNGWVAWWSSDTGANGSKVTGFNVYRWNRSTHVFDKVDVQTRGDSSSWSYVDTSRPKGTTTYYRVTATLADGTETAAREMAFASEN
ncbi:PA14 domain-containing protein [Streptomyces sp. HUAS MG47]|uniref:PA14 domain-containing protein n=1 Tax=Streptomyces solicamelliae TaxID=3231716 RepID=UPI003878315C